MTPGIGCDRPLQMGSSFQNISRALVPITLLIVSGVVTSLAVVDVVVKVGWAV